MTKEYVIMPKKLVMFKNYIIAFKELYLNKSIIL